MIGIDLNHYGLKRKVRSFTNSNIEFNLGKKVVKTDSKYEQLDISEDSLHIVEYHLQHDALGKKCANAITQCFCNGNRSKSNRSLSDYFWGCCLYFEGKCNYVEKFTKHDYKILINSKNELFGIKSKDLDQITELHAPVISKRMNNMVNETMKEYYCPIHFEEMILRKRRMAYTFRSFFMGCPRFFQKTVSKSKK